MQFSVGVEYAFHSLFYMVDLPKEKNIGIREIAGLHGITETYLSKIFSKLKKAGIVRSVPGVKGGYELAKSASAVSFWDVIEAVEGPAHLFHCAELRKKNVFVTDPKVYTPKCPCLIKVVIQEAEDLMRDRLRKKSLRWLYTQAYSGFSADRKAAIAGWLENL